MTEDDDRKNRINRRPMGEGHDRMLLKRRFDDLADILPGEGFSADEITDAMIRALCRRIDDRDKLTERVGKIADQWFGATEEED